MFHNNGWKWMCQIVEELETGVVVMPEVETVFYEYIDRGIDVDVFARYLKVKYPKIRDLWINQNYMYPTNGDLRALYDMFNFRSFVIEANQCGLPLEDFSSLAAPKDGLIALWDSSRKKGILKLGDSLNIKDQWYKLCRACATEHCYMSKLP